MSGDQSLALASVVAAIGGYIIGHIIAPHVFGTIGRWNAARLARKAAHSALTDKNAPPGT